MPWRRYGRGWGAWGRGRGWGGRGNPYPICRAFPWLPRGWWRFGYYAPYTGYTAPYSWWRPRWYGPYPYPWTW